MGRKMTREEFVEELGITPEQMLLEMDEFQRNIDFVTRNYDKLRSLYLDRWIIVQNAGVAADAPTLEDLITKADQLGIPRKSAYVESFPREEPILILQCR